MVAGSECNGEGGYGSTFWVRDQGFFYCFANVMTEVSSSDCFGVSQEGSDRGCASTLF